MWLVVLSDQLPVIALVSRYLTNKLIGRGPIRKRQARFQVPGFGLAKMSSLATCGINSPFDELSPTSRQVAHVLRTLTPLNPTCIAAHEIPFDLHVLSTPPAFVLSQNQTLREKRMGSTPFKTGEPKVCADDLLKSPLNLTDYFLPRPQRNSLSARRQGLFRS